MAANIANSAPGTLQLRYLHTLVKISAEKNSTILFPLPMEVMRGIQMFGNVMEQQLKSNGAGLVDANNAIAKMIPTIDAGLQVDIDKDQQEEEKQE